MTRAVRRSEMRRTVVTGSLAGWAGGLAFGAAMLELGVLPTVASLVRTDSAAVGAVVHMIIAAIVGTVLAALVRDRWSAGDLLFWGAAFGAAFWFIGPLTLQPLLLGRPPMWDEAAARAAFPSLLGHVLWGATAGIAIAALRSRGSRSPAAPEAERPAARAIAPSPGVAIRGLLAGVLGLVIVGLLAGTAGPTDAVFGRAHGTAPTLVALIGAVLYACLHPRSTITGGGAVVRGAGFGFILWVIGGLTILPVVSGDGLNWSIAEVRAAFPGLPGGILFGAVMALTYHWLGRAGRVLFSEASHDRSPDGGSWGVRAVMRGAAAGVVGGIVFTFVLLQIDALTDIARLVGSSSSGIGLLVHLAIASIVGMSYGLLFRRQAFDTAAAIGWGASYGFVWWVLGPLTLAPVILGAGPEWDVMAAAAAFPSLIGHLAFGVALGLTTHRLEARYSPWWISRSDVEAARMVARRAEAVTAGPALWAILVLIAMLLPIVLVPSS